MAPANGSVSPLAMQSRTVFAGTEDDALLLVGRAPSSCDEGAGPSQLEAIALPFPAYLLGVIGGSVGIVTIPSRAAPSGLTKNNIERQFVHNCGIFGLLVVRYLRRHNGTAPAHG